ncbi:TonB-dependent receptor [Niabella pedocola]|uniref:TonB-dependent receptor n=1 Tax=Niabella pedocola TaxID=1752077 RepID=A0ABS8PXB4_9BACT|nr:TonB-dependent receptor [Niabella pedocola]MCD2425479.1 TonB-dependent receptor [Niabella pedocola]
MIKKILHYARSPILGCLLAFLFTSLTANAQQKKAVSGNVTAAAGGPLQGVSVTVKNNPLQGTTTDEQGNFRLETTPDAVLIISAIGYLTQEQSLDGRTVLNLSLEPDTKGMEEVVVIGYGTTRKVNLTGAVSAVSGEDMAKRQVGQTSMALQGVAPGVTVTQSTGQPGVDGGTIRIRGIGTLNNSNPLVLVDGIVMSMNAVDVSSIESISVLKDAASAAIYGSRAANGVILITTKRGKKGKFSFSYDGYVGKQSATDRPKMVNGLDHMLLINEAHTNVGLSPLYSEEYINNYKTNKDSKPDLYPDTDWQKEVLSGSGIQTNHVIALSGGTERVQFFGSFGYLNQGGLIDDVSFRRYYARLNTNVQISPKLSGSFDVFLVNNDRKSVSQFPGGSGAALGSTTGTALIFALMNKLPAIQAVKYSNGQWAEGQNGVNPVAIIRNGGFWRETSYPISGNFSLSYKPFEFLTGKISFAPTYSQPNVRSFVNVVKTYDPNGTLRFTVPGVNTMDQSTAQDKTNQLEATLTFSKNISKHSLGALAGYQYYTGSNSGFSAFRDNFLFPDYPVLSGGSSANMKNGGYATEWALISYFGRINYAYDNRYLLEANLRYDGSSRFAAGNKWGTFPSFSAGWRISEEPFMAATRDVLSELKLRASWGRLGNQEIGNNYPFAPTVYLDPKYISNGQIQNGAAIMNLANTNISWETTEMSNIGLDARLLRNLSVSFDYYYKKTNGILLELSIPKTMGVAAPFQNAGVVENKGWDFQLNYSNTAHAFKYGATFTLSDVKNKILDIKGIQQTGTIVNREGYPINSLYLLKSMGLLSSADFDAGGKYLYAQQFGKLGPGDIRYTDVVADGIINGNDRQVLGSTIPRFTYSLNLNADYKGIDFSIFLQGVGKRDGYLTGNAITPFLSGGTAYEYQKNRWTKENPDPNAVFPRFAFGETNNTQISDFWMKSAAYLRVKNVQLGYTIPKQLLQKAGISQLRIYLSGENLFTADKFWPGWDPEIDAASNGAYYPQVKTYNLGINLKF